MSTLYITEFSQPARDGGIIQIASEPSNSTQTVAISGSSTASTVFKNNTNLVRIHTDSICSIAFGTAPTATTSSRRMNAGDTEYYGVPMGKSYEIAVISNT